MIHLFGSDDSKKEEETTQGILDQMDTYLQEKYGKITYEILSFIKKGWDIGYDELNAKAKGKNGAFEFKVTREEHGNSYVYRDSYFEYLIKEQADETVTEVASEVLKQDEFKILLSSYGPYMGYTKEMTKNKTFLDAISEGEYDNTFAVIKAAVVCKEDCTKKVYEEKVKQIAEEWFKEKGVHCGFSFYFVKEEVFDQITPKKLFRNSNDEKLEEYVLYISK